MTDIERANEQLREVECPQCSRVGSLRLVWRLVARPLGSFSLAGVQMKVSAYESYVVECSEVECDFWKLPKVCEED